MLPSPCHPTTGARPQPACELADIFRLYGPAYRAAHRLPLSHLKVMRAIETCRTAALGGHKDYCARCGYERYSYNSCRNRHCPKCQGLAKAQWLEQRRAELLPVPYFHNVFTLPHELNTLLLCQEHNERAILTLLFRTAAQTLLQFGRNHLGGTPGITLVLHTWDQQLRPHFHVHCLITGGALSSDGQRWTASHPRFLFPVRAVSKVFRGKFLAGLQQLYDQGALVFPPSLPTLAALAPAPAFAQLLGLLRAKPWVVFSKAPVAGPEKLLDYLGRYTRRVALSNARLLGCGNAQVQFRYQDRAHGNIPKIACLSADEFIHRFLHHVLPAGFRRIRHYGLLAGCHKAAQLSRCRQLLGVPPPQPPARKTLAQRLRELLHIDIERCPQCGHQPLQRTALPSPGRVRRRGSAATAVVCTPREDSS